jgi:short-subunit dehydrogenase
MAKTWFERLVDGPVRTECLRIARNLVKAELKAKGVKVSLVEAEDVARATIRVLNANKDYSILKEAKRELRSRDRQVKRED